MAIQTHESAGVEAASSWLELAGFGRADAGVDYPSMSVLPRLLHAVTESPESLVHELLAGRRADDAIPSMARDARAIGRIESVVQRLPTSHEFLHSDARLASALPEESVHLVVTSPPYWNLKRYNDGDGQLGHVDDYAEFNDGLDKIWRNCYRSLVPGGRLIINVGDVCLSRRKNNGRHTVVPLHATIQERCKRLGFDNLAPIIWHKISNANYEVSGGGAGFLGKPYEPNAVIKNDIEYVLMQRKPGGYRSPTTVERVLSIIPADRYQLWFRQIWSDIPGASTSKHPAPYPLEFAERLIRMFSFAGDTVLDPFLGSGTTSLAAARWGRNSIGIEVDPAYMALARKRMTAVMDDMYAGGRVTLNGVIDA
jgi:DNA modification methylase